MHITPTKVSAAGWTVDRTFIGLRLREHASGANVFHPSFVAILHADLRLTRAADRARHFD